MSAKTPPNDEPEPKKKRRSGPEPETLYIPPDKVKDTWERLIGRKPMPPTPPAKPPKRKPRS